MFYFSHCLFKKLISTYIDPSCTQHCPKWFILFPPLNLLFFLGEGSVLLPFLR